MRILLPILLMIFTTIITAQPINDRPIIAILAQRYPDFANQSYISASYVKYLESAGARVVPIPHYFNHSLIQNLFTHINGLLLPGGTAHIMNSDFYDHAKLFWDLAIAANDKGTYFPIWGTCLGFQTLCSICANKRLMSRRVASDIALPLELSDDAKNSKMFRHMSEELFVALGEEDVTYNHHDYGLSPGTYLKNRKLREFFRVLSLNHDLKGREFISTIEAYKYPIYGIQWHPEKTNFEFTRECNDIPHNARSIAITQYMANFLVNEARRNMHTFPTKEMEDEYLIYRYTPVHSAHIYKTGTLSKMEQIYLF